MPTEQKKNEKYIYIYKDRGVQSLQLHAALEREMMVDKTGNCSLGRQSEKNVCSQAIRTC